MISRFRLGLIVFFILLVLTQGLKNREQRVYLNWITDSWVASLYKPVAQTWNNLTSSVFYAFDHYFFLSQAAQDNDQLRSDLDLLRLENQALTERLRRLELKQEVVDRFKFKSDKLLSAVILNYDLFLSSKTMLIDKGFRDGVRINNMVLAGAGLVGRILKTYDHTSKVLLLIDPHFSVDAINQRSQARLLVSGLDENTLGVKRSPFLSQVEFLEEAHEIEKQDVLITSGLGEIYPYGIPIGRIHSVKLSERNLFDNAWVLPAVDFTKLSHVFVSLE